MDRTPPASSSPQLADRDDQLPGLVSTSVRARRYRDLIDAFLVNVGGIERCSEIKLALIRRLAGVVVQAELLETRLMNQGAPPLTISLAFTPVAMTYERGHGSVAKALPPETKRGSITRPRLNATGETS